ncbi:MAG: hypothetical protein FWF12_00660 [Betaproteobacteria bacterium]|nr:hypothetical protein [Betaproteobacteria bacterium]
MGFFYDTFIADYTAQRTASCLAEELRARQNTGIEIEYMESLESLARSLESCMAELKRQNKMVSYRNMEKELKEVTEKLTNLKIQLGLV